VEGSEDGSLAACEATSAASPAGAFGRGPGTVRGGAIEGTISFSASCGMLVDASTSPVGPPGCPAITAASGNSASTGEWSTTSAAGIPDKFCCAAASFFRISASLAERSISRISSSTTRRRSKVTLRNSAITLPIVRARPGNFSGPKTIRATMNSNTRWGRLSIVAGVKRVCRLHHRGHPRVSQLRRSRMLYWISTSGVR
jgi:hypothetical protein